MFRRGSSFGGFRAALEKWLAGNRHLQVKLFGLDQDQSVAEFRFDRLNPAIRVAVSSRSAIISVAWCQSTWDILFWEEVDPVLNEQHAFCGICAAEDARPKTFPSLAALWADHLFEPLGRYVALLQGADRLALYSLHRGTTWAEIQKPAQVADGDHLVAVLPLWLEPG